MGKKGITWIKQKGWATIDIEENIVTEVTFGSKPIISSAYRSFTKVERCEVITKVKTPNFLICPCCPESAKVYK